MKKVLIPTALAFAVAGCNSTSNTANVNLTVSGTVQSAAAQTRSLQANSLEAAQDAMAIEVLNNNEAAGTVALSQARFVLEEIELDSERDDDDLADDDANEEDELELAFEGPIIADIISQTLTPELATAEIAAGQYQEIEIDVDPVTEVDWAAFGGDLAADDKLRQGYSVHLVGTYTDINAQEYAIEVLLDEDFEKEQSLANDLVLTADSVTNLSVTFDLTGLFDDIDLVALAAAGAIVIDSKGDNNDVADVIANRIEDSLELAEE
ncbi:YajG family lipoprotein [Salinibius halmophilus]|uniref:hypothetical protein n=1 Tax=Salinibius halmophilus TaxID=1853216 RepID=UPI000E66AEF8|nr:hypothetical protein [Salinibius halmophilus]